jgi:hypothetical protein
MQIRNYTIKKRAILGLLLMALAAWVILLLIVRTPSNDRLWAADQEILPFAEFDGDVIQVKNIRNFEYLSRDEYVQNYYDKTVLISDIESVDYIVEPLASVAVAHTLLSFGLKDGSRIAISIEIRKEAGEEFSPLKGIFEEYEIMYVVVDERDALTLRAVHRDNPVYIYPTVASKDAVQQLFVNMLERATALRDTPEFYNTLTNTCATRIADHINEIVPSRVGWDYRILLPKDSDLLAYELGFIDNSIPLEELRETYLANERIKANVDDPNFSVVIREQ